MKIRLSTRWPVADVHAHTIQAEAEARCDEFFGPGQYAITQLDVEPDTEQRSASGDVLAIDYEVRMRAEGDRPYGARTLKLGF